MECLNTAPFGMRDNVGSLGHRGAASAQSPSHVTIWVNADMERSHRMSLSHMIEISCTALGTGKIIVPTIVPIQIENHKNQP